MDISLLLVLGLIGISFGITIMISNQNKQRRLAEQDRQEKSQREQYSTLTTTKCPQCAEDIKLEAKICRYCRADVSQNNAILLDTKSKEINDFEKEQFQKLVQKEINTKHGYTFFFFVIVAVVGLVIGVLGTSFAVALGDSAVLPLTGLIIGIFFFFLAISLGRKTSKEMQERLRLWEEGRQSS